MLSAGIRAGQPAQAMRLLNKKNRGFSLVEVLVTFAILALCLTGLLATYVSLFYMSDLSRNTSLAVNAVQAKMEEIKNAGFDAITAYNGSFDITGFASADARGVVSAADVSSDLRRVRIVACFKSRGLTIGNDINNCTSSPVEAVTLIVR